MMIKSISTTLVTSTLNKSRAFYEQYFAAKPVFDCGWYVVLQLPQDQQLCLMEPQQGMQPYTGGLFLNLQVDHADELLEVLQKKGLKPQLPLEDHPWGDRGFGVQDPSGVMVYCYHPIQPSDEFAAYFIHQQPD